MIKFQCFISVVLVAAALIMLYCCMDLEPQIHYMVGSSKNPMIFSSFRRIHNAAKYNTNNTSDDDKAFFHHIENTSKNHSVITNIYEANNINASIKGMILVTLYAEQQVGAAMNLFSLQKWAKLVGASVVEPFVHNSMFKLPVVSSEKQLAAQLRYSDYFDIDIWNNMSIAMNGTPLIPWEEFIDKAPKKYIFVAILNSFNKVETAIYIGDEIMKQKHCSDSFNHLTNKYSFYIDHLLQVKLVRRVCLSFYKTIMHIDNFTETIYGNFSSSDVIVWFQVWKGFAHHDRVRVLQQYFFRSKKTFAMLHTSKRISDDSKKYIKIFLNSEPGLYTAISIRTVLRGKYLPRSDHSSFFHDCIKKLGSVISSISIVNSTKFVAIDLGRFGDSIAGNYIDKNLISDIETDVFQTVYNNSLTMQKWEQSFIQATNGITDSGYIAALQRTVVESSQCLVLFGGKSNFQRTLSSTYKEKHINASCIYEVCYKQ